MTDNYISHYGLAHDDDPPGRGSGRYAWGSGENPGQHQFNQLARIRELRQKGMSDADIAITLMGVKGYKKDGTPIYYSSNDLRAFVSVQSSKEKARRVRTALDLYDKGLNNREIAERLGVTEGTVRNMLKDPIKYQTDKYQATADMIRKACDNKGIVDVGADNELYLGVTRNTFNVALSILEQEGYKIAYVATPQSGQNKTNVKALVSPDVEYKEAFDLSKANIYTIQDFSEDGGATWKSTHYPNVLDSDRVYVRYSEEGGSNLDGTIQIRPGVDDLSLGDVMYAQVRINVDNKAYMKGMALYSDDIPEGYDVVYNTNKKDGTRVLPLDPSDKNAVMKPLKINKETGEVDQENPFGALIKAGGQPDNVPNNVINKLQEEGDWENWSKTLSPQFLSKQPEKLINQQIDLTIAKRKSQLDEINELTNEVVKKKMLEDFAGRCDTNAANLKADGFKNQSYSVLLPGNVKEGECYCPNQKDGDDIILIRYPHGGTFEIPYLKVNNKSEEGKKVAGGSKDAIVINQSTAEQLSGADFDGDFAVVIPVTSNRLKVSYDRARKDLLEWDNKTPYKLPDDAPYVKTKTKNKEMGVATNLITDMTAQDASMDEIVRAVKYSMVVIDSEKHHLDYKKAFQELGIHDLKVKYQGVYNEETGNINTPASTIFSRSNASVRVNKRKEVNDLSKMTPEEQTRWKNGEVIYHETGETKKKMITDTSKMTEAELQAHNAGKKVWRQTDEIVTTETKAMNTVSNAMELVRNPNDPKELAYANFANEMKAMANTARATARAIKPYQVDKTAKETYKEEVESLNAKLTKAKMNSPKERRAEGIANAMYQDKLKSNPDMDYEHRKRTMSICMDIARQQIGAKKEKIDVTEKEWEAIQAKSIPATTLSQILDNMDTNKLVKLASPKTQGVSDGKVALAKSMAASGMYTYAEIADAIGVSTGYVSTVLKM